MGLINYPPPLSQRGFLKYISPDRADILEEIKATAGTACNNKRKRWLLLISYRLLVVGLLFPYNTPPAPLKRGASTPALNFGPRTSDFRPKQTKKAAHFCGQPFESEKLKPNSKMANLRYAISIMRGALRLASSRFGIVMCSRPLS